MHPKLSIITINLDNVNGLVSTFESVFKQSFQDYEYIVIDGGSTDGSYDLIKENSNKLAYWISEPDSGVYQAMNKGIIKAKGDYLLFLNSGDYLAGSSVLNQVFESNKYADILLARCNITQQGKVVHVTKLHEDITFGTLFFCGINHQSTFIRKNIFKKYGLYNEDYKYNGDIEFWFRAIIMNNATTESLSVVLTNYNLEGMSTTDASQRAYKAEIEKIYSNPAFQKFVPDYRKWKLEKEQNKILYWAKSKKAIFYLLELVFNISKKLSKLK